ncbi:glycosyltransferase [Thermophagus sp. OGC60D27]|uniref:glycosyltransferase n=1 Tax=Thermophagus sp. OGC60D27 TaxID=3458415 RepID=UPI0040376051
MKNQRMLYVAEVQLPGRKASSIHVMRMCRAFALQGIKVKLLAFSSKQFTNKQELFRYYDVEDCFEVKLLKSPGTGRLSAFYLAFRAVMEVLFYRPDIAYTRSPVSSFFFSFLRCRFVYEAHVLLHHTGHKWLASFFRRFSKAHRFLGMVAISSALKNLYVERGTPPGNIFVAHDGADAKPLDVKGELKGSLPFNAGYFGNVYKGRGVDIIIGMAHRMPGVGFHIIGGLSDDIDPRYEIPDNLFFYGFLPPSEVHLYRNACDVLLAPYQPEVFVSEKKAYSTSSYMSPLKIFEYMSACKPIIVSDMPVLREVLTEDCAMLVPPSDESRWVGALDLLTNNEVKRKAIAMKAYDHFCDRHTWNKRAEAINKWILEREKNYS